MNIERGWKFNSADFSVQSHGVGHEYGSVTLIRAPDERARWHQMSDEDKDDEDGPPLYIVGHGVTIQEAITNANLAASHALPIIPAKETT